MGTIKNLLKTKVPYTIFISWPCWQVGLPSQLTINEMNTIVLLHQSLAGSWFDAAFYSDSSRAPGKAGTQLNSRKWAEGYSSSFYCEDIKKRYILHCFTKLTTLVYVTRVVYILMLMFSPHDSTKDAYFVNYEKWISLKRRWNLCCCVPYGVSKMVSSLLSGLLWAEATSSSISWSDFRGNSLLRAAL